MKSQQSKQKENVKSCYSDLNENIEETPEN